MSLDGDLALRRRILERAFARAQALDDPFFVAGRWPATLGELASALGCTRATAAEIGLCRAPAPAEDIPAWALALAARFGLDQERLEALGRRLTKSVSVGR